MRVRCVGSVDGVRGGSLTVHHCIVGIIRRSILHGRSSSTERHGLHGLAGLANHHSRLLGRLNVSDLSGATVVMAAVVVIVMVIVMVVRVVRVEASMMASVMASVMATVMATVMAAMMTTVVATMPESRAKADAHANRKQYIKEDDSPDCLSTIIRRTQVNRLRDEGVVHSGPFISATDRGKWTLYVFGFGALIRKVYGVCTECKKCNSSSYFVHNRYSFNYNNSWTRK